MKATIIWTRFLLHLWETHIKKFHNVQLRISKDTFKKANRNRMQRIQLDLVIKPRLKRRISCPNQLLQYLNH